MMSLVGRKPFWPITAMHLLQGGLFYQISWSSCVRDCALSPNWLYEIRNKTPIFERRISGWCAGICVMPENIKQETTLNSGWLLRRVLIAARVVLKLRRTLSFTLKVFISRPSELLWTLEWHNDLDWDSSQRAFCSQMQTFQQAHILFYLCEPSLIKQLWPWLDHLGDASVSSPWRMQGGRATKRRETKVKSFHEVSLHFVFFSFFSLPTR